MSPYQQHRTEDTIDEEGVEREEVDGDDEINEPFVSYRNKKTACYIAINYRLES